MPQLRQWVIAAADPARLGDFYCAVFELDKIDEVKGALFLSNGVFNLALIAASELQKRGLKHLSFDTVRTVSIFRRRAGDLSPGESFPAFDGLTP